MEQTWQNAIVVLWLVVIVQGFFVLMLYRQVGIHLLNRAEALSRDGLEIGSPAPAVEMIGLDGTTVRLRDLRDRPQFLIFGSPTCRPCRKLLPELVSFAAEHTGIQFLFVSLGPWQDSLKFRQSHDFGTVMFLGDPEGSAREQFLVRVTPFGHLIDAGGNVRSKGLVNNSAHLALWLEKARAQNSDETVGESDEEDTDGRLDGEGYRILGSQARKTGTGRQGT